MEPGSWSYALCSSGLSSRKLVEQSTSESQLIRADIWSLQGPCAGKGHSCRRRMRRWMKVGELELAILYMLLVAGWLVSVRRRNVDSGHVVSADELFCRLRLT